MAKATKEKDIVDVPKGTDESKERIPMGETPESPVNIEERKPEKVAPLVNVRSAGKISQTLEGVAKEFRRLYPDQECRWVFHSMSKPELSNVIGRMAEGYSIVNPEAFKDSPYPISAFIDEKKHIRLADTVLMKIPAAQRDANRTERQRMANEQLSQVQEKFRHGISQTREGRHSAEARGGLKFEERDHDLSYEQPDSKE